MTFPMADAHCDFLYYMVTEGRDIGTLSPHQAMYLPYMRQGGVALQFFAVWMDADLRTPFLQQCLTQIDAYHRMLTAHSGTLIPFAPDFDPASGKIATVLTIEGGEAIEGRLENLRLLHRLGVRAMTLTWNNSNELAATSMRRGDKGLTKLGRRVVREMCDIGVALDVAHLSDAGIRDALEIATRPIFASHSNARAVCPHKRSLPDDLIRAIGAQGGVVGVNFYHRQLAEGRMPTVEDFADHLAHIAQMGGMHVPVIGSDFDGMVVYPPEMPNSAHLPAIAEALLARGFTPEQVQGITYNNLSRYISQFC